MELDRQVDPRRTAALAAALWLITVLLYLPTAGYDFISFDDPLFVTANPHVNEGVTWDGLRWAFTRAEIDYWRPLCWLTHMIDVELYGLDAGGHHVTSFLLHAFSAVLLFYFLLALLENMPAAFLVAALFAWHPLHVESVAWIAERKDVLCGLFWHATLLIYVRYARSGRPIWLFATLACYFLGVMSKPMIVTLPCQLLLLDFWPLRRAAGEPRKWLRLFAEKLPFFALTAAASAFTFQAQLSVGEMRPEVVPPLDLRLANAVVAYAGYLGDTVWPQGLGIFYPFPAAIPTATLAAAGTVLLIVTYAAGALLRTKPFILIGWLWFLGTIVPVVGVFKVGGQASADRYTYIATTGLFWIVALLLFPKPPAAPRSRLSCAAALLVTALFLCHLQIRHWRNSVTLFSHTVSVTEDNWVMMNNLARSHLAVGDLNAARFVYERLIELKPHHFAHYFLGKIHLDQGRPDLAAQNFEAALQLEPSFHLAAFELGELARLHGDPATARALYERVLRSEPEHAGALDGLRELSL